MKKKSSFSAVSLRGVLIVILVLAIGLAGVGFYYAYGWIKDYATQVNQAVVTAYDSTAPTTSASTKALQAVLAQQGTVSATLAQFYASPSDFQSKAIQDINTYARASGLSIGDVTLGATAKPSGTSTPSQPPTNNTTILSVKLNAPVSYTSLVKFMTYVQNNLPKMQIQGLTIQSNASGGDTVTIDNIAIKVVTQ